MTSFDVFDFLPLAAWRPLRIFCSFDDVLVVPVVFSPYYLVLYDAIESWLPTARKLGGGLL